MRDYQSELDRVTKERDEAVALLRERLKETERLLHMAWQTHREDEPACTYCAAIDGTAAFLQRIGSCELSTGGTHDNGQSCDCDPCKIERGDPGRDTTRDAIALLREDAALFARLVLPSKDRAIRERVRAFLSRLDAGKVTR